MLGYFPDPYPDESFYSICARYSDRMSFPESQSVSKNLLNKSLPNNFNFDFPKNLDWLISNLSPGHKYTSDYLIKNHTLLPLFTLFISPAQLTVVKNSMCYGSINRMHPPKFSFNLTYLLFCPLCVERDRNFYGECYWHRIHQVYGVRVCPIHKVILEKGVEHPSRQKENTYISAEAPVSEKVPKYVDESTFYGKLLLSIARNIEWLFNQNDSILNIDFLRKKYSEALLHLDLAYPSGKLKKSRLLMLLMHITLRN